MANSDAKTGPGLILSLVTLSLGFVLAMAGMILGFQEVTATQTSSIHDAPGSIEENFDPGQYDIYGESLDFRELIAEDSLLSDEFEGATITVRDPSGQLLPVSPSSPESATNRGFTVYAHVGSFVVTEDGAHTVEVQTAGVTTFVVAESFTTAWRDAIPWIIVGVVGTVLVIAGLIMLVMGIMRRQRAKNDQVAVSPTPVQFPPPASPPESSPLPPSSPMSPPPPPPTQNPSSF